MKRSIFRRLSSLFILITLVSACSDIAEDERLIYVEPAAVGRAVLIEDFTGQRCVNCPLATDVIAQLQEQYGEENVIAVGIHSEPLGFAGSATVSGLMNDESRNYGLHWGVETQPIGLVNRVGGLLDRAAWMAAVYNEIQKTSPVEMEVEVGYDATENAIKINTDITALYDVDANLQLWLVQDNIVSLQSMPDGSNNRQYVHNHVFRAAINGAWGEPVKIANGRSDVYEHSFVLDSSSLPRFAPAYVPEDCAVVAFLYDSTGVLQVVKKHVTLKETEN